MGFALDLVVILSHCNSHLEACSVCDLRETETASLNLYTNLFVDLLGCQAGYF